MTDENEYGEDGEYGEDNFEMAMEEEEEEEENEGEDDDPLPPPPEEDKELLFLIEFLVDTLTLFPQNMDLDGIDPCALQGATSIDLTFLHFPPLRMGEKDTDPDRITGQNLIPYNMGKSLMFALTESQFEEPPPIYLTISAAKDMPHAFRFSQFHIGKTKIQLSELFKQVFQKYDENPGKTVSKSIKDCYELISEAEKTTAEVSLYIRLTCLGENIVTEFLKGEDPQEPMLFKNKESKKVYECKEAERPDAEGDANFGDKICPNQFNYRTGPEPGYENYEEIYAEINGSVIRVEVEKSKRKDPPKQFHISEFCDCDIPLPQKLVAGMSDLSLSPASERSVKNAMGALGGGENQGGGPAPDPADKRVGLDPANQLIFNVPPVQTLTQPGAKTISYNVHTCPEKDHGHKPGERFKVMTPNQDASATKLPNDPEKDVFILRIIKRGKSETGKESLTLEFKTPKEKIVPPERPPYLVESAAGPDKGKKDKGKKKKF